MAVLPETPPSPVSARAALYVRIAPVTWQHDKAMQLGQYRESTALSTGPAMLRRNWRAEVESRNWLEVWTVERKNCRCDSAILNDNFDSCRRSVRARVKMGA